MCVNIHWKHREVALLPPLARGFFWATASTSTFYYRDVVKNRLDITPTTPLTLGKSGVECVEIVWKGKGNFYRLLLNLLIIALFPCPSNAWRAGAVWTMRRKRWGGGGTRSCLFAFSSYPVHSIIKFLEFACQGRYWNARVSRDLFRYKYMYERKEFLKKENKRTNKRISWDSSRNWKGKTN